MFDNYFYLQTNTDIIVYEAKNVDSGVEMNLYFNEKLVDSKQGLLGTFELVHENIKLEIKNSALKSKQELTIDGAVKKLEKVKKKRMREILSSKQINNAVNPTEAEIEAGKFKFSEIQIPLLLIIVAVVIRYFTHDFTNYLNYSFGIPAAIGGWMLYEVAAKYSSIMRGVRKARIGFVVLAIVIAETIAQLMIN